MEKKALAHNSAVTMVVYGFGKKDIQGVILAAKRLTRGGCPQ
jgi:hypothetical protein